MTTQADLEAAEAYATHIKDSDKSFHNNVKYAAFLAGCAHARKEQAALEELRAENERALLKYKNDLSAMIDRAAINGKRAFELQDQVTELRLQLSGKTFDDEVLVLRGKLERAESEIAGYKKECARIHQADENFIESLLTKHAGEVEELEKRIYESIELHRFNDGVTELSEYGEGANAAMQCLRDTIEEVFKHRARGSEGT